MSFFFWRSQGSEYFVFWDQVRTAGGDKVVSLLDLPRPFNALKALDIDALAEQVLTPLH